MGHTLTCLQHLLWRHGILSFLSPNRQVTVGLSLQETLLGLSSNEFGSSSVTVDDAVNFSNNALEHTIRCILAAVQAPEVLDSSKGTFSLPCT